MQVQRKSQLTGKVHTLDIPCTEDQLNRWLGGELIQRAMPSVPAPLREFLKTGITPEEWKTIFGAEDISWENEAKKNQERKPMYENEMTKAVGMYASCNCCDRIIFEDENWREQFAENGGYCKECMQDAILDNQNK